jgi:glycosyltransferase involved in cell wall biosynthesis
MKLHTQPISSSKKRVLVDLSILKHLHCGLGQIAWNYGLYYKSHAPKDLDITLLVPKEYVGAFGTNIKYKPSKRIYRVLPWLLPTYDLWHSIHQLSLYAPSRFWTKNLLTIHDLNYLYEKKGTKISKYHKWVQKRIDRASFITTISHFTKDDVENHMDMNEKPNKVIYNGVEMLDASKAQQPLSVQDAHTPFFFTIGQIKKKKNFHTLLDLMKLYPQYNLYIAGQDHEDYAEMIRQRITNEKIENAFLIGTVNTEEKIWLYKNCKAFLFPSLFEGFGLPVIEAMSFGKPVFSSPKTSLSEIGGKYAFFWNSFEPHSMKEVIDQNLDAFYNDPQRVEATKQYAHSFSYQKHMEEYFKLYNTILFGNKRTKQASIELPSKEYNYLRV